MQPLLASRQADNTNNWGKVEMEILDVILQEVRQIRGDLDSHVRDEDKTLTRLRDEIHSLHTQVALSKQQGNALVACISTVISAVVAWLVTHLGVK